MNYAMKPGKQENRNQRGWKMNPQTASLQDITPCTTYRVYGNLRTFPEILIDFFDLVSANVGKWHVPTYNHYIIRKKKFGYACVYLLPTYYCYYLPAFVIISSLLTLALTLYSLPRHIKVCCQMTRHDSCSK